MEIVSTTASRASAPDPAVPAYELHGAGTPLVYVCGIEGSGLNFYKQLPDLIRDHAVITYPLRGKGKYGLDRLIEDVRAILRDTGFERATFIGESFGGLVVQGLALAHPEVVERIILVNTFASFLHRAKLRLGLIVYSCLPQSWVTKYRSSRSGTELFSDDIEPEDRTRFLRNTSYVELEGYLSRLRIIRDTNFLAKLHLIKIPALIVTSTADGMLDAVASGRAMADRLPRAKTLVLEGTGHLALLSNRVRVRDWLAKFTEL